MKRYVVKCIQISGKGRLLFDHGQECTAAQLDNVDELLRQGAIEEVAEEVVEEVAEEVAEKPEKPKRTK